MKKMTRVLSLVLAMVLCVGAGVGATLAWLTTDTDAVTNTFVEGKIIKNPEDFVLKEHKVTEGTDGSYTLMETIPENETNAITYTVLPGKNLPKDPFVRVDTIEDAYLFITMDSKLPAGMTAAVDTTEAGKWMELKDTDGNQVKLEGKPVYVLKDKVLGSAEPATYYILKDNQVEVKADFAPSTLGEDGVQLIFDAYLVQGNGPKDALTAWTESFGAKKAA